MVRVFIGYDEEQPIAFDGCKGSIIENNKKNNIEIIPINYNTVTDYNREPHPYESTQFATARFWVPYESDFKGVSIFCDCSLLFIYSIDELIELYDEKYAVMCCHHTTNGQEGVKMNGKKQTSYMRKNWSSLIIFNNSHPKNKNLTPDFLNKQSDLFLHQFQWLDDSDIGRLPRVWNYLVGCYYGDTPKALNYTKGGPWFDDYEDCDYSDLWYEKYHKNCSNEITDTKSLKTYLLNIFNYIKKLII